MSSNPVMVSQIVKFIKNSKGFERILDKVKIVSAGNGNCVAEYKVEEEMTNVVSNLHGGFSATLVDAISSYALFSHKKGHVPSVSVDMHMTYLKGAKLGETIIIDTKTLRVGKTLGYLDIEIRSKESNDLLVRAAHSKYLLRDVKVKV